MSETDEAAKVSIWVVGVFVAKMVGGDKGMTLGRGAFFQRSLRFWNQAKLSFVVMSSSSIDMLLLLFSQSVVMD